MRVNPINQNTSLPNRNTLFLAASGGGKSQALSQCKDIPKNARVILWDPDYDHTGHHFTRRPKFVRALIKAIASDKPFRIALSVDPTEENYEWFCEVVWGCLDGNKLTYIFVEELADTCKSVAKASPNAGILLRRCRKYGGIFMGTTQRPQEIPKTYFTQCIHRYVGRQKGEGDHKKMAKELGVSVEDLKSLNELEFFYDDGTPNRPERLQLKYKKVMGIREVA